MPMYVHIYIYTYYTYTHTHIYIYIHVYIYILWVNVYIDWYMLYYTTSLLGFPCHRESLKSNLQETRRGWTTTSREAAQPSFQLVDAPQFTMGGTMGGTNTTEDSCNEVGSWYLWMPSPGQVEAESERPEKELWMNLLVVGVLWGKEWWKSQDLDPRI